MKLHVVRPRVFSIVSVLCLVVAPYLRAQTVQPQPAGTNTGGAQPAAVATTSNEEVVVLSPFVVDASEDQNSYKATSTLAGTRVRTDLKDVASAISVVTQQFLQDTGAKNNDDLLPYTPSTEVSGIRGNFSGVAGTGVYQENTISNQTRVRGLDSADNTRDYFLTDIPWDGYNVGRVDLQRGPNSILFGIGSPAGIINTSLNDASFKTAYNVENRLGQYGAVRDSINLNQELIKGVLAIRIAAVKDDEKYEQKPAFNNSTRYYAALRFDPKLFSAGAHTSLKVKFESGDVQSNNPRSIPPEDVITQWFNSGVDSLGHYGLNKFTVNQFNTATATPWGTRAPGFASTMAGGKGGNLDNGLVLWNQTRSYWPDIDNYYEDTPTAKNNLSTPIMPSGNPIYTIAAQPQTALGIKDSGGNTLAGVFPAYLPLALPGVQGYMQTVGSLNINNVPGGQTPMPGAAYYADKTLSDPSVYNFYTNLLDGPNKHEWKKWNAINVALEQTFFDDRLGLQVAFDHQDYNAGALQWMAGEGYQIQVDINQTYTNQATNLNVGRPYVGNAASAPGLNYQDTIVRNTFRFTPTYELRFEDIFGNTTLAKILGKSVFTGVYEEQNVKHDYNTWAEYAVDPSWKFNNEVNNSSTIPITGQLGSDREFDWVAYIGPNIQAKSSPAGLGLQRLNFVIAPPPNQTVTNFNATWNHPNPNWNAFVPSGATPGPMTLQGNGDYSTNAAYTDGTFKGSYPDGTVFVPSGNRFSLTDGSVIVTGGTKVVYLYNEDGTFNKITTVPVAESGIYRNPIAPPPGYVNPGAPYTFNSFTDGTQQNVQQYQNPANYVGWQSQSVTWLKATGPNDPAMVESANRSRFRDISRGFTYQGYFLNGDLVPTIGWRKDVITNFQTNAPSDPNYGFTTLNYPDDAGSRTDVRGESKTWGAVYHFPKFLTSKLPGDTTISLFYDHSDNFKADASRLSMAGTPIPNANGTTREYGFTITTLQDKLTLKVDWFKTKVSNATLADTQGNSIGGMGGNAYFIADGSIWGWSWAANVQEGLMGNTPNSNFYDSANADGLPKDTPAHLAAYDAYNRVGGSYTDNNGGVHTYIGGNAIVNAWLGVLPANSKGQSVNAPYGLNGNTKFFSSYNLSPAINPQLAAGQAFGPWSGRLTAAYVGGISGGFAGGVPAGGGSNFGNHQTTVDNLSNGTEVELTYQPVKNWNISLNYTHVNATHQNVDPVSQKFMSQMTGFMNGPGGQVREWYNGGGALGAQWNSSLVAPYTVELNELGHAAPEVAPWRLNLVTTYMIDHGIAKGVFLGGGLRIEAGRIIGYKFDSTFVNANSKDVNYQANPDTGMNPLGLTAGGLNVNQPFYSSSEHHIDAWVGYSKKVTRDINWRIQLNIRSVGEKDRLTTSRINPDGSIALQRIVQGMGWQLTNSFDF